MIRLGGQKGGLYKGRFFPWQNRPACLRFSPAEDGLQAKQYHGAFVDDAKEVGTRQEARYGGPEHADGGVSGAR